MGMETVIASLIGAFIRPEKVLNTLNDSLFSFHCGDLKSAVTNARTKVYWNMSKKDKKEIISF